MLFPAVSAAVAARSCSCGVQDPNPVLTLSRLHAKAAKKRGDREVVPLGSLVPIRSTG